jgi:hypothetical protein
VKATAVSKRSQAGETGVYRNAPVHSSTTICTIRP